jgi:hypothetical protein
MLIDNKFIYLSLPRCASASFHYSCILNDLSVQTYGDLQLLNNNIDFKSVDKKELMNYLHHGHESIIDLQNKFGNKYPIISVKRQRHERFYSLYKHVLFDLKRMECYKAYEKLCNFSLDELFFFTTNDIISKKQSWETISNYLIDLKLIDKKIDISKYKEYKKSKDYEIINIINILLTPQLRWTNNNQNIIWFDFNELNKLEEWISITLKKPFILHSVNSSKHMDGNIKLDDAFVKKYNDIYDYFDIQKNKKTLI